MNKIKSLFIGIFPVFAMGVSVYGIYILVNSGMNFVWLGAVLISLPVILFFSRVMIFKDMPRTSAHFPLITTVAVLGLMLSVYGFVQSASGPADNPELIASNKLGMILASLGFIAYLLYNFWYSSLDRLPNAALQAGQSLPAFSALGVDGEVVDSSTFEGAPAIFLFFRGNWCPLCMAQITEIVAQYRELSALGAKVVLLAPQPEKNTQALADKFNVPFVFLTDEGNRAAQALGIAMENGLPTGMEVLGYDKDTVYPTVLIVDGDGVILYSDLTDNYRVRPEPEEFLKVLRANAQLA
ncbi:MAG: redoxin domain-containing protein [Porticoccaceae bacterium]|nr:redoxin domain-containing protein [Porticoccaceae bacterium]